MEKTHFPKNLPKRYLLVKFLHTAGIVFILYALILLFSPKEQESVDELLQQPYGFLRALFFPLWISFIIFLVRIGFIKYILAIGEELEKRERNQKEKI